MEIEVGGDVVRLLVVCRMLNRAKIIDFHSPGYNDHAAWMLACGALNTGTADCQPFFFSPVEGFSMFLRILAHVAHSGLIRHCGDGTGLEHVVAAEEHLCIPVGSRLILP